ncbi:MAG: ABC transporter permease [Anaerorhabdus sp.]
MRLKSTYTWIGLIIIWQILALTINNNIIIPFPIEVLNRSLQLIQEVNLYLSVLATIKRVFVGFFYSFIVALVSAILSDASLNFRILFKPIQALSKSIPNITYIIIVLIWFGSEGSVSIICSLVLFPVLYSAFMQSLDKVSSDLKDIERIYPESFFEKVKSVTLPMLIPVILSASKTAIGLGLKISVMAEILGQVEIGIGKQLYLSRINLDTVGLFSWTIFIIIICYIFDYIFDQFINKYS